MTDAQGQLFGDAVEVKADREFVLGGRLRDEAIAQVDRNAEPEWKDRALQAVHTVALRRSEFIAPDVFALIERPREARAMGPVMMRAKSRGWIVPTGHFAQAPNKERHLGPCRVWRSLIVGQA
jgi:hypothetical protein